MTKTESDGYILNTIFWVKSKSRNNYGMSNCRFKMFKFPTKVYICASKGTVMDLNISGISVIIVMK